MNGWCRGARRAIGLGVALATLGWGAGSLSAAETKAVAPGPPAAAAKVGMTVPAGPAVTPEAKGTPAAAAPPAAAPVAKEAAPPPFAYVTVGKADPFKPFVELTPPPPPKTGEAPKRKATTGRPISPLQQAEASQFHLVGIIGDQARRIAMVEDRAGKRHYTLSVGAAIGTNDGRVVSILPDRVIIEEKVPLEGRKTRVNRVTLMLHKENEGKP